MFLLALIYLIVLVVCVVSNVYAPWNRLSGPASLILFIIIGIVLFMNVLNK